MVARRLLYTTDMQRVGTLIVIVLAASMAACGAVPPPQIGITAVNDVVCTANASDHSCSTDVDLNVFLPDGVADRLTVVVSSPAMGSASLAGNASGELSSQTRVRAQGSAPTCEPGPAPVYVSSMLNLPSGEVSVDGLEVEADIRCE